MLAQGEDGRDAANASARNQDPEIMRRHEHHLLRLISTHDSQTWYRDDT